MERTLREGGIKEVAELLSVPARCGIVLTRARIRAIASHLGVPAGMQSKSRMVESLFRAAGGMGKAEELLELMAREAGLWSARYRLWQRACPPASAIWEEWTAEGRELARHLRRARKLARKTARG
ncbi:MAG: hypothetical protein ACE5JJ_06455 [Nitrospinota bacterium]